MRVLYFVAFSFMASIEFAAADTMVVRGGEHGDFTRLTIAVRPDAKWEVEAQERSLTLLFDALGQHFDLSQAFARIGRERISAISFTEGALHLDLSCECETRAFRAGKNLIAIDVADSKEKKFDAEDSSTTPDTLVLEAGPQQHAFGGGGDAIAVQDAWLEHLLKEELQSKIANTTNRAAIGGKSDRFEGRSIAIKDPYVQLRLRNGDFLPELSDQFVETAVTPQTACPTEKDLGFLNQPLEKDPIFRLSELRTDVFSVTGRVNAPSAFDLVEYYAFLGLGEESLAFSDYFRLGGRRADLIRATAAFMADRPPLKDVWSNAQNCGPRATFWSFVAEPMGDARPIDESTANSLVQFFAELAPHLQRIAKERLAARLDAVNQIEAANRVRELAERRRVEGELLLDAYANTLSQSGADEHTIADTNRLAGVDDVIALTNTHWEIGTALSRENRELLEAFRFESRDHKDSDRAAEASFRAALLSGDFSAARAQLLVLGDGVTKDLKSEYLETLIQVESDAHFLVTANQVALDEWTDMKEQLLPVADRAALLGFNQLATNLGRVTEAKDPTMASQPTNANLSEKPLEVLAESPARRDAGSVSGGISEISLSDVRSILGASERLRGQSTKLLRAGDVGQRP